MWPRVTAVFHHGVSVCILLLGVCQLTQGAPFQNLNFEATNGVATGVPFWTTPAGIDYLFNATFAGEGSLTLFNSGFSYPSPPVSLLEGSQSLLFVYDPIGSDPPTGGALFQSGDIPTNATALTLLTTNVNGIRVRVNGTLLPLTVLETIGKTQRVVGNISAFSGTTATLRIESPFGTSDRTYAIVDDIRFVPEPGSILLFLIGGITLSIVRRRRGRR